MTSSLVRLGEIWESANTHRRVQILRVTELLGQYEVLYQDLTTRVTSTVWESDLLKCHRRVQ